MDAKVFRLAILTIISAFILVLVIIYATNTDKINELFGWGEKPAVETAAEAVDAASLDISAEVMSSGQIGDDLDAFIADEDFFDETESIPAVVVRKQASSAGGGNDQGTESVLKDEPSDGASSEGSSEETKSGSGMAIVGELINPNPTAAYGSSVLPGEASSVEGVMGSGASTSSAGYLTSIPPEPEGGFGTYIPADQTISGTPVGTMP